MRFKIHEGIFWEQILGRGKGNLCNYIESFPILKMKSVYTMKACFWEGENEREQINVLGVRWSRQNLICKT